MTFFHLLDLKIDSAPFYPVAGFFVWGKFESAKTPVALYPYMMEGTETFGGGCFWTVLYLKLLK